MSIVTSIGAPGWRSAASAQAACDGPPLTEQDVEDYLRSKAPAVLVRQRITTCGVAFIPSRDTVDRFRRLGATDQVLSMIAPPSNPDAGAAWTPMTDRRSMVWVPAGTFEMGSPPNEARRDPDEERNPVRLDGFWMDATEVTKDAYRRFVLAQPQWQKGRIDRTQHDGKYLSDWNGNEFPAGEGERPVVWVSWYAANAYAAWAGKRLPSEAEWEYAARAGTTTTYWWGNSFDARRGNNSARVMPVGDGLTRNAWGLADMLGNVWEWTASVKAPYPYRAGDGREDPAAGGPRTIRGGAANQADEFLRAANRNNLARPTTNDLVGFRCAR